MKLFWGTLAALSMLVMPAKAETVITVDLSAQMMYVESDHVADMMAFPVSTARKGYKTPYGEFKPYYMTKMHYSKKYDNAPMPNSIFFHGGYAIHATYDIKRLGRPASHGCVRLHPEHAKMLYELVKLEGMEQTWIQIVP